MAKNYDIVVKKALDDTINTSHISADLDLYEAARTGFFIFQPADQNDPVLKLIAQKMRTFNTECEYDGARVQELLKLNVTRSPVPHFSVAELRYRRGNEEVKFAGIPTFESGRITIDDIVGIDTKSIVEAWLELAYNLETRTGGRMYEYKMDCNLVEYTQDYRPIRTWTLVGCFVTGISEDDFDKTSDGQRSITINISYDRAFMVRGVAGKASESEKIGEAIPLV